MQNTVVPYDIRFQPHKGFLGLFLLSLTSALVWGQAPETAAVQPGKAIEKPATSRITHVTVYPDTALVTREVRIPEAKGLHEIVVGPLPASVVGKSLYGEGSDGIRVLATRFRSRAVEADTRKEVRELQVEEDTVQDEIAKITSEMSTFTGNMAFLTKLEAFAGATTVAATDKAKLDSAQVTKLAKFLMDSRTDQNKEVHDRSVATKELQKKLQFIQRKRGELSVGSSKTEREAVLVVERVGAGKTHAKLSYLVENASWKPQYRLRSGKNVIPQGGVPPLVPGGLGGAAPQADANIVKVEYLAAVTQQSGEDWSGVNLEVSNAQPRLNASPPELRSLAVVLTTNQVLTRNSMSQVQGRPGMPNQPAGQGGQLAATQNRDNIKQALEGKTNNLEILNPMGNNTAEELEGAAKQLRFRAQTESNLRNEFQSNEIWNYAGALDQARDLTMIVDEKPGLGGRGGRPISGGEGPTISHRLPGMTTISSRNDDQVLEVARFDLPVETFFKAVPVLTPHVYRQGNLNNKSDYVILPGEATMYHQGDFVGRMALPLVAVGEQFIVGFGVEPQLQVKRTLMEKTRSTQGGNQVLKFEYRILASSYLKEKVKVQVWDRLPLAEGETVNVLLGKAEPEMAKDALYIREERSRNLLRWDLDVEPGQAGEKAKKITYDFRMELDKNMSIGSFMSK